jgi:hypothetical protein
MSEQTTSLPGKISCASGTVATADGAVDGAALGASEAEAAADGAAVGDWVAGALDGLALDDEQAASVMATVTTATAKRLPGSI